MAARGQFIDEADRQARDPLHIEGLKAGMHGRWVRTKGHNVELHHERLRRLGYVPVERDAKTVKSGDDPRATFAQGAQQDGTVKRSDLMLMQIPLEQHTRFRQAQQAETRRRTGAVNAKLKAAGGYDETE